MENGSSQAFSDSLDSGLAGLNSENGALEVGWLCSSNDGLSYRGRSTGMWIKLVNFRAEKGPVQPKW